MDNTKGSAAGPIGGGRSRRKVLFVPTPKGYCSGTVDVNVLDKVKATIKCDNLEALALVGLLLCVLGVSLLLAVGMVSAPGEVRVLAADMTIGMFAAGLVLVALYAALLGVHWRQHGDATTDDGKS